MARNHAISRHSSFVPYCGTEARPRNLPMDNYRIAAASAGSVTSAIARIAEGVSQADLARSYGVSQATISRLVAPSPFGADGRCRSRVKPGHGGDVCYMTALPPKADVRPRSCYVAEVPKPAVSRCSNMPCAEARVIRSPRRRGRAASAGFRGRALWPSAS
jgi:hypothetical protein